jgi:hypothetical protein
MTALGVALNRAMPKIAFSTDGRTQSISTLGFGRRKGLASVQRKLLKYMKKWERKRPGLSQLKVYVRKAVVKWRAARDVKADN